MVFSEFWEIFAILFAEILNLLQAFSWLFVAFSVGGWPF